MAPSPSSASDERPAKRRKPGFDYLESITVLVGEDETKYHLHKALACDNSDFFRAAFTGDWKEKADKVVRLPEVDDFHFGVFQGWLYTGALDFSRSVDPESRLEYSPNMSDDAVNDAALKIASCYALGDMLGATKFRNAVVDEFIALVAGTNNIPTASTIWETIPKPSTMARLLVDYISVEMHPKGFIDSVDFYPADLVKEVAKAAVKELEVSWELRRPGNRPECHYHEHKDESDKCS